MSDRGHAAVEFALAAGLLLIPVAIATLAFGPWAETRVAAEAGAAGAARAAVLGLDLSAGESVLEEIAVNHGIDASNVRLGWCGNAPAQLGSSVTGCPLTRGTSVTAQVRIWTPLVSTPWGGVGGLWVDASNTMPIDLYRSLG